MEMVFKFFCLFLIFMMGFIATFLALWLVVMVIRGVKKKRN